MLHNVNSLLLGKRGNTNFNMNSALLNRPNKIYSNAIIKKSNAEAGKINYIAFMSEYREIPTNLNENDNETMISTQRNKLINEGINPNDYSNDKIDQTNSSQMETSYPFNYTNIIDLTSRTRDKIEIDANNIIYNNEKNEGKNFINFKKKFIKEKEIETKGNILPILDSESDNYEKLTIFEKYPELEFNNSSNIKKEKEYQLKRYRYLKNYKYCFDPVKRKLKAQIIQIWWRTKIYPKIEKIKKLIKIQSLIRGYLVRKAYNEILYMSDVFNNFIELLRKSTSSYVRRNYFPKRLYKKKYAMEKIFPIKLRQYLRKWRNANILYKNELIKAKDLYNKRKENRKELLILKTYFLIWKSQCEHYRKIEDKKLCLYNQNQRLSAVGKLVSSITNVFNKRNFIKISKMLKKFLINKIRKKILKEKITKLYDKYRINGYKKKYLNLWKQKIRLMIEKELKLKIFSNQIENALKKNEKENLRNKINKLRGKVNDIVLKELNRTHKKFTYPSAIKHMVKFVRINTVRHQIKDYIRRMNIKKKLIKLIKNKSKKHYLNLWNKIISKIKYKELLFSTLLKVILKFNHLNKDINLSKYFHIWKGKIIMNKYKNESIYKYKNFGNKLIKYIRANKMFKFNEKGFMRKLSLFSNPNKIKKSLLKCLKINKNKNDRDNKKRCLNKWKKVYNKFLINDIKGAKLKSVCVLVDKIIKNKLVSKCFNKWKNAKNLSDLSSKYNFGNNTKSLINALNKIDKSNKKNFFKKLGKIKENQIKKIILVSIIKNISKRTLLKNLNKWKINSLNKKNKLNLYSIIKNEKLKDIVNKKIKKQEKNNYGALNKYLYQWYLRRKLIDKENYNRFLLNIKKGVNLIKKKCNNELLRKVLYLIKYSKVKPSNEKLKGVKKYFVKNDKNNLLKGFYRLLKQTNMKTKKILKMNILFEIKNKHDKIYQKLNLLQRLNKWCNISQNLKEKEKDKGNKFCELYLAFYLRFKERKLIDTLKLQKKNVNKLKGGDILIKTINKIEKNTKTLCFNNWKNTKDQMKIKQNRKIRANKIIYNTMCKVFSYKKLDEVLNKLENKYKSTYNKEFFKNLCIKSLKNTQCHLNHIIENNNRPNLINLSFKKSIKPQFNPIKKLFQPLIKKEYSTNSYQRLSRYNTKNIFKNNTYKNSKYQNIYSEYSYSASKRTNLTYVKRDKENEQQIEQYQCPFYYKRILPDFVDYLERLRNQRLGFVFEQFKLNYKLSLFCFYYKSFCIKNIKDNKKALPENMKLSIKLSKFMRQIKKDAIKNLCRVYLKKCRRMIDVLQLTKKTFFYKNMNILRNAIKIFRVWRVYVKILKYKTEKLEMMEDNFSETYESLAKGMFNERLNRSKGKPQVLSILEQFDTDEQTKLRSSLGIINSSFENYFDGSNINKNSLKCIVENIDSSSQSNDNSALCFTPKSKNKNTGKSTPLNLKTNVSFI